MGILPSKTNLSTAVSNARYCKSRPKLRTDLQGLSLFLKELLTDTLAMSEKHTEERVCIQYCGKSRLKIVRISVIS